MHVHPLDMLCFKLLFGLHEKKIETNCPSVSIALVTPGKKCIIKNALQSNQVNIQFVTTDLETSSTKANIHT